MLVDDEMDRDMLSRRLRRKGYDFAAAHDGDRAQTLIRNHRFGLVLLDVKMPGLNGLEVLKKLREAHTAIDLPTITATARGERDEIMRALGLGANHYVTKPLDFPVALARVQTPVAPNRKAEQVKQLERGWAERNSSGRHASAPPGHCGTASRRIVPGPRRYTFTRPLVVDAGQ